MATAMRTVPNGRRGDDPRATPEWRNVNRRKPVHYDDLPTQRRIPMKTRDAATTNARLDLVLEELDGLLTWAKEDSAHASAQAAPGIAEDDDRRAWALRKAITLVEACKR